MITQRFSFFITKRFAFFITQSFAFFITQSFAFLIAQSFPFLITQSFAFLITQSFAFLVFLCESNIPLYKLRVVENYMYTVQCTVPLMLRLILSGTLQGYDKEWGTSRVLSRVIWFFFHYRVPTKPEHQKSFIKIYASGT